MKQLLYLLALLGALSLFSCQKILKEDSGKLKIVTTTNILTDLVQNIGKDSVSVRGLMGSGVDPHLYKASEGDVIKLAEADLIIYSGLHLEGKMVDVFERMKEQGRNITNLGASLDPSKLRQSADFGGNYDPHVWFDISLFKGLAKETARSLGTYDPDNRDYYEKNLEDYLKKLDDLEKEVFRLVETLPKDKRRLVTAHDAFSYFGKAYGFEVVGLQGISTATEAGVQDVRRITKYIIDHQIKSIFIENSVPKRTIEALQKAVEAGGHEVAIGGMLYSDSLGSPDTEEGTYIGMFTYNVKTLVNGLK